jgi:transposase
VRQEKLLFLADNPFYTKRFGHYVGRRCRSATVKDVAKELRLDWSTVKAFEIQYMKAQMKRYPPPKPKIIGIDEISLRKRHVYRVVVSDLDRRRPLFFGGQDRSEASLDLFYKSLGKRASGRIRLAVMDMWKAFEASTRTNAPQAAILYDKFHVLRHLNEALDKVRRSEYARIKGPDRRFIKGQKYTLLSSRENLTLNGRASLQRLLKKNKRLYTAYLLKESFEQLWSYRKEAWARRFFDNWRESLKSQRLPSYVKFAEMIERHWDGIAAYCAQTSKSNLSPIGNWVGFAENQGNQDQLTVTIEKRTTSTPERSKTPWECSRMSTSRTLS